MWDLNEWMVDHMFRAVLVVARSAYFHCKLEFALFILLQDIQEIVLNIMVMKKI